MAITQITSQVISSNVVTATLVANSALETRHYSTSSITADKLAANTATASPIATALNANIDLVQSNVVSTQTNVNTVSSNAGSILSNLQAYAARANANINLVQSNVAAITDNTTDLNIDDGTFFIDKNISSIGIANTNPQGTSVMLFGTPSNIVIDWGIAGGNLLIGAGGANATSYRLDVRGTANTGTLTSTSVSSAGVELRANDYATYLVALGGLSGANTAITNLQTGLTGANTDITNLVTGLTGSNTSISSERANVGTLQSAVLDHQNNIANIIDGTTPFTDDVTMQQSLTIQGNLTVLGAQVLVGVGSTSIYDAILTLSANLDQSTSPPVDSGILVNRGNQDNVFIGFEGTDNHIHFVYTDSGEDATTINELGHVDLHANSFHAESSSVVQPAYNKYDDQNTGIHFPAEDTISFVTGGIMRANITSSGNLALTSGYIQAPGGSVHNSLSLHDPSFNNGIIARSFNNFAVLLDHNNNGTTDFFGIFNDIDDPAAAVVDSAVVSVRAVTGDLYSKGRLNSVNSNVTTDIVVGNATISDAVFSNGVELRANDYATYLMALGGLSGANTTITNLVTGLEGANTNISSNDTDILNLVNGLEGANTYALSVTSNVGLSNVAVTTAFHANDYITYTRINANLNAVSSNADGKVDKAGDTMSGDLNMGSNYITNLSDPINAQDAATRAYALGLLGSSIVPTYVTNTSTGTSNVIALTNSPTSIDTISVALNGVVQAPTADWIFNTGNNSIQYTVASLPSGLVSVISAWDTP
jgi:hypothetical protein